jgi:hypothetical protein
MHPDLNASLARFAVFGLLRGRAPAGERGFDATGAIKGQLPTERKNPR